MKSLIIEYTNKLSTFYDNINQDRSIYEIAINLQEFKGYFLTVSTHLNNYFKLNLWEQIKTPHSETATVMNQTQIISNQNIHQITDDINNLEETINILRNKQESLTNTVTETFSKAKTETLRIDNIITQIDMLRLQSRPQMNRTQNMTQTTEIANTQLTLIVETQ